MGLSKEEVHQAAVFLYRGVCIDSILKTGSSMLKACEISREFIIRLGILGRILHLYGADCRCLAPTPHWQQAGQTMPGHPLEKQATTMGKFSDAPFADERSKYFFASQALIASNIATSWPPEKCNKVKNISLFLLKN